jgi:hypothetical protein
MNDLLADETHVRPGTTLALTLLSPETFLVALAAVRWR